MWYIRQNYSMHGRSMVCIYVRIMVCIYFRSMVVYMLELWHDYSIYTTILPKYIQDVYSFVAVYDMAYYSHTIVLV